jgi:starch-binding outer membrane protein, SusD/RagB family
MKHIRTLLLLIIFAMVFAPGCEDYLTEVTYSELDPTQLLNNVKGAEATLLAAYAEANHDGHDGKSIMNLEDWSTDIEWETGGGENRTAVLMIAFTWDASLDWSTQRMWNRSYRAIRDANVVIDDLGPDLPEADRKLFLAEARFVRAWSYYRLWTWYGAPILRTSLSDPAEKARCTEAEIQQFLEDEFLAIIPDLPNAGEEKQYGRATKGAAMGFLTKFYLNSKQWSKCADMAQQIIALGDYSLFPVYADMCKTENEENAEFIWANQGVVIDAGNGCMYINGAKPIGYKSLLDGSYEHLPGMRNWAAQYRLYDDFYNSFEVGDLRKDVLIDSFVNGPGDTVSLLGANNTRSFKYWPDVEFNANSHGNDLPEVRYADILLARAESLNELNGPTQEGLDLINMVRTRAGLPDIVLGSFASTAELRTHILKERGWEFFNERIRRQDLIRHDRYWQSAQERGKTNAAAHHVVFPIPQTEIYANPLAVQNPGY